jgi:hypothetical protein
VVREGEKLHRGKALGSKIGCRKARIHGSAMEERIDDERVERHWEIEDLVFSRVHIEVLILQRGHTHSKMNRIDIIHI